MQRRAFVSALAASGLALPAWSQKYPSGPTSIVLPLQAGSASDVAVRHMAERLSQRLGQGFAVENVAAAAGLVGLDRLSRARVDGSVVAALNNSIMTILPHLQSRNHLVPKQLTPAKSIQLPSCKTSGEQTLQ